jgi:hypothetical protein
MRKEEEGEEEDFVRPSSPVAITVTMSNTHRFVCNEWF